MINIVLYRPEKPANTGNIMRTCVAINAKLHIIGPISFSIADKDLKRVGLDYMERLDATYYESIEDFFKKVNSDDVIYVTRYADKVYSSFDFSNPAKNYYIMFGRESTGIPKEVLVDHPNQLARLPMVENARSLNLSNCVAVVAFEALRQQNFNNLATSEIIKGDNFLDKFKK